MMRKLLLSSIVLFLFSASILMFQMSCKKEAKADNPAVTQSDGLKQLGKIIYQNYNDEVWLMNYDGTGKQKLNIPYNEIGNGVFGDAKLSPDGQRIFFNVIEDVNGASKRYIRLYSSKLDGSDLKKILDTGADTGDGYEFSVY